MSENDQRMEISALFEIIDDLPEDLQERIMLFRARISERQKYREQLPEIQSSLDE